MGTRGSYYHRTEDDLIEALAGDHAAHLGRAAILMYLQGRKVCNSAGADGNDGHMTAKDVRIIVVTLDLTDEEYAEGLAQLVDFGWWEPEGSGYFDRRYLTANRTEEQRRARREGNARDQAEWRKNHPKEKPGA